MTQCYTPRLQNPFAGCTINGVARRVPLLDEFVTSAPNPRVMSYRVHRDMGVEERAALVKALHACRTTAHSRKSSAQTILKTMAGHGSPCWTLVPSLCAKAPGRGLTHWAGVFHQLNVTFSLDSGSIPLHQSSRPWSDTLGGSLSRHRRLFLVGLWFHPSAPKLQAMA